MRARRVNPEECFVHGANTGDEVEARLHGVALDRLGCADLGKTHGVTASSDVHHPRCPIPNQDRYQATSKVSHHEQRCNALSIHPLIAPNERWRTAGMARQSRPTSTANAKMHT